MIQKKILSYETMLLEKETKRGRWISYQNKISIMKIKKILFCVRRDIRGKQACTLTHTYIIIIIIIVITIKALFTTKWGQLSYQENVLLSTEYCM